MYNFQLSKYFSFLEIDYNGEELFLQGILFIQALRLESLALQGKATFLSLFGFDCTKTVINFDVVVPKYATSYKPYVSGTNSWTGAVQAFWVKSNLAHGIIK